MIKNTSVLREQKYIIYKVFRMILEKTIDHLSTIFISKNSNCFNNFTLKIIDKNLNKNIKMNLT